MNLKTILKNLQILVVTPFFKNRKYFHFLKYYYRGRSYIFDIINFYENNNLHCIFDVGANIGLSAKEFRKYFKQSDIFCFEPVNDTFEILKNNLKNKKRIICENFALGNISGELTINLSEDNGLNSLVEEVNENFNQLKKQKVKINTIDKYVFDNKITKINLIKIDTEGFDLKVLEGASDTLSENKVDFIVCEVGFLYEKHKGNFEEINRYLQSKNYLLAGFYDNYYWGTKNILHGFCNAMFVSKRIAFS